VPLGFLSRKQTPFIVSDPCLILRTYDLVISPCRVGRIWRFGKYCAKSKNGVTLHYSLKRGKEVSAVMPVKVGGRP
jgi:hypothetical protein